MEVNTEGDSKFLYFYKDEGITKHFTILKIS